MVMKHLWPRPSPSSANTAVTSEAISWCTVTSTIRSVRLAPLCAFVPFSVFLSRSSALNAHNATGNMMQGLLVHGNLMDSADRTAHDSSPSWSRLHMYELQFFLLAVEQTAESMAQRLRFAGCVAAQLGAWFLFLGGGGGMQRQGPRDVASARLLAAFDRRAAVLRGRSGFKFFLPLGWVYPECNCCCCFFAHKACKGKWARSTTL